MYVKSLERKTEGWGPEPPFTLETLMDLGFFHLGLENLRMAEVMFRRALQGYAKKWSPNHQLTLSASFWCARTYKDLNQYNLAEKLFFTTKRGYAEWLGPLRERTSACAIQLKEISTARFRSARKSPRGHAI